MYEFFLYNPLGNFTDYVTAEKVQDGWVVRLKAVCACCGSEIGREEHFGKTLWEAVAYLPISLRFLAQEKWKGVE